LVSNWAYVVMASFAWSLRAWSALLVPVAVENDPAIEVRTAATGALLLGWPDYSRNQDVLGR
jgi:hypothetical protein